jgi:NADH dehydrogenase [ubiquinone] 1 alpha subcomplex assembly factor 7
MADPADAVMLPVRLDAFMARANATYYATRDPFADFTTAPEISQAFGEILGAWAAVAWDLLGRPSPVILAETGPGRGTLMADALRAIRRVAPAFGAALRLHLIETSPRLRAIQAERLPEAVWHDGLATLPDGPLLLLGNEFFDALPIRQFVRRGDGWAERHVGPDGWVEMPVPDSDVPSVVQRWAVTPSGVAEGAVVELCEPALAIAATLGRRFATGQGAALFLDYGPEHSAPGESLQAIAEGRAADPLGPAGSADLTAHVDFAALATAAVSAGAAVHGPVPQGLFLARLGLFQRTNRLARHLPPARAGALTQAAQRLAEPNRMGRLFKALAISSPGVPTLPGFEG